MSGVLGFGGLGVWGQVSGFGFSGVRVEGIPREATGAR